MSGPRARRRTNASAQSSMTEQDAASAIQAWFNGNTTRSKLEEERVISNVEKGANGPSTFSSSSQFRRRSTVRMSKVIPNVGASQENKDVVFFAETKFNASLKGIIDIQGRMSEPFTIIVNMGPRNSGYDKDYSKYETYLALHVDHQKAWFSIKRNGIQVNLTDMTDVVVSGMHLGLDADTITTYWLSYDRDNMIIKYGKGYAMEETTLLICDFSEGVTTAEKLAKKRKQWSVFFGIYDPTRKDAIILLYRTPSDIAKHEDRTVKAGEAAGFIHMEALIEVRKFPLVANPSPFVLDATRATLNIIDKGLYTFSSELPTACKVLYDTMVKCELDLEFEMGVSEVRLSDAVRYSINTEGGILNKTLKTKNYLRITMGKGRGESPGIPYVLEFWPPGARSPIHNHGSVCGMIKILYGTIQNGTFNKVPSTVTDSKKKFRPQELMKFDAYKDDVLWLSPEWYQTHQLRNVSNDFCATVNCYRYDENDEIQWNLFDFVNDQNGEVGNFFPNTDFTFGEMRKLVFDEWANRMNK